MTIHLGRPLPDASRDRPGRQRGNPPGRPHDTVKGGRPAAPTWSCSRWGLPCHPRRRGRGALLPHPFTLALRSSEERSRAVCFLWHCPWGRPRRVLPGTVFPWSPDFPPPPDTRPTEGGHPAVWHLLARPGLAPCQPTGLSTPVPKVRRRLGTWALHLPPHRFLLGHIVATEQLHCSLIVLSCTKVLSGFSEVRDSP